MMVIRSFEIDRDFEYISKWISDERAKRCYEGAGFTERKTTPDAFKYQDESWGRCNMVQKREDKKF